MPNTPVRAAAEGMPSITRRKALSLTGSGLVATLAGMAASTRKAPAAVIANDADLRPLIAEWRRVHRMVQAYAKLHRAAEERFYQMRSPKPERPEPSAEEMDAYRKLTVAELGSYTWSYEAAYQEAIALWAADEERCRRECGLATAEAEWEGLHDMLADAAYAVLNYRVQTFAGLAAKMRVDAVHIFDATDFAEAVSKDIRRIARKAVKS